jgi:hypothetical protein
VGHPSGSVFAWFILRSVSLGFFSGSGVFPLGFGGPVGVLGLGSVFLICLLGVFLWVSCGFLVGFLGFLCGLAEFASMYTSCVLRGALRFFNEIILLIKKKKYKN